MDSVRSAELGRFLRSRRDRLSPADVDLPDGPRRRVPGLRREEVAVLANIGVTWYTWLEQGRAVHASEQVLEAIADALLPNPVERAHLFQLGGHADRALEPGLGEVDSRIRDLLDDVAPSPAVVLDNLADVVA
ncbi:helix-turn-helix domain-containing protein [Brachybacterium huguangmaarense]